VLAAGTELEQVAGLTVCLAGADLANVVNEAALVATRRRADAVTLTDFTQAIERGLAGVEKKTRVLSPRDRAVVAFHEMVTRYGMDEGLGQVSYSDAAPRLLDVPGASAVSVSTSPQTAERIDRAVQRIVQAGFVCASDILATNRELLDRAAQALLAKETLDEAELAALVVGLLRREPPGADAGRTAFASGPVRDEPAA
jgi:ATP-dependent Zn protease